jgi:diguanylate cyclase (GGDEF)-like protein
MPDVNGPSNPYAYGERQSAGFGARSGADEESMFLRHRAFLDRNVAAGLTKAAGIVAPAELFEFLQQAASGPGSSLALLTIDISRFHAINQAHGYAVGDRFLDMVLRRLAQRLGPRDLVTRLGGDEFAVLLCDVFDSVSSLAAARQVLDALREPFALNERPRSVTAHAGIALCPASGRDVRTLLHAARAALRSAKETGLDVVAAQPVSSSASSLLAPLLAADGGAYPLPGGREIRDGLLRGEFKVHYQPIHNFGTGEVDTLEALVRWRHPTRGLLEPASFLPAAERAGLAHVISVRVLDCACDSLRYWRARGHDELRVAVNLSAQDFRRDDFAGTVTNTLERHKLPPSSLELELTEHEQLDDELAMSHAAELARYGVALTLDDFGVKYSTLRYLHRLPVRALKVDRSFVRDVGESAASNSIVSAIIGIAGKMGLRLVAEGVEQVRQMNELRRLGCHIMQGFLFSPPVAAEAVDDYLQRAAPAG